jgi:hypothetical protein
MHEMIVARRAAERKEERYDLFSGLLDASDDPSDKTRLSDDELIGMRHLHGSLLPSDGIRKHLCVLTCWS